MDHDGERGGLLLLRNKRRSHSEIKTVPIALARSIEIWRITADISFILRGHPSLARSHRLDDCRKRLGGQRKG